MCSSNKTGSVAGLWKPSSASFLIAIFKSSAPTQTENCVVSATSIGNRGGQWHLLTAGAFMTMLVPLAVFLLLQRTFVRGILAGSVK